VGGGSLVQPTAAARSMAMPRESIPFATWFMELLSQNWSVTTAFVDQRGLRTNRFQSALLRDP
jgi:hypothetical protein